MEVDVDVSDFDEAETLVPGEMEDDGKALILGFDYFPLEKEPEPLPPPPDRLSFKNIKFPPLKKALPGGLFDDPDPKQKQMQRYANLVVSSEPPKSKPWEPNNEQRAMIRLWEQACKEIRVRHPDPLVTVELEVKYGRTYGIEIWFRMYNIADTANPDYRYQEFTHKGKPGWNWPGYKVAHTYIASLWTIYMIHESMELATYRDPAFTYGRTTPCACWPGCTANFKVIETPVVDAHNSSSVHQRFLDDGVRDFAATIDWTMGLGHGRQLVEAEAERARKDVENEKEPWEPTC